MKRVVSASFANVVLTAGVVFAVTFAIGFTLLHQGPASRWTTRGNRAKSSAVFVRLPPIAPKLEPVVSAAAAPPSVAAPSSPSLRVADLAEPFDPPPPPMEAGIPVAAATANPVARDPAIHDAPPLPARAAVPQDIRLHFDQFEQGDAAETHRVPAGRRLSGAAIVTAALELNVAGKPLKLAGVKLPISTDLCAPNANYAVRSCADVTRQALAAVVGAKGEVSCQILSGGRSAWPAVCRNSAGEDLAAYLIAHGFALADDDDMIDYSAAETQARAARSGLWSYR